MFRNTYQKGFLSLFYSIGSNPLLIWKSTVCCLPIFALGKFIEIHSDLFVIGAKWTH